ncbi:tetratricopeptide repeat protein [Bosea sp. LjRoot237]|uniref:tetratricopeptide repeat protein n=1 Tax=Bosea sp. LjRoot237 TaxID=3342292 RepID=UPI003ECF6AAC
MTEIRAFVGHSFTENDKHLIRKFTDFFDQTHRIRPDFSWVHAEVAEPTALAVKVLSLVQDSNLFIAICSRKEKVVKRERADFLARITGKSVELEWKTSDWIIQEIGLAIGRQIPVIILLEDGVRKPGGLQGDIEYIPFLRQNPDSCFGKFMEMVSSLSPKDFGATSPSNAPSASTGSASEDKTRIAEEQEPTSDGQQLEDWAVPKPDWTDSQHRRVLEYAVLVKNDELQRQIEESYKRNFSSSIDVDRWDAAKESMHIRYASGGSLDKIKEIVNRNDRDAIIISYLARALISFNEYISAAKTFEKAALNSNDHETRADFIGHALLNFQLADADVECARVISLIHAEIAAGSVSEVEACKSLGKYAELAKDDYLFIASMERLLELKPDDSDARFKLAYRYSEIDFEDLGFWHYLAIPRSERSSTVWNNLGISYKHFNLNEKSVVSLRKSTEFNDHSATLAMANLAARLQEDGFKPEAEKLCEDALKIENYHSNVPAVIESIRKSSDDELVREKKKLTEIRPKNSFLREYAQARFSVLETSLSEDWQGNRSLLKLTLNGRELELSGSYESNNNSLGALGSLMGENSKTTRPVKYKFAMSGRSAVGTVIRRDKNAVQGILSDSSSTEVLAWVDAAGKEITVLEGPRSGANIYRIKVV